MPCPAQNILQCDRICKRPMVSASELHKFSSFYETGDPCHDGCGLGKWSFWPDHMDPMVTLHEAQHNSIQLHTTLISIFALFFTWSCTYETWYCRQQHHVIMSKGWHHCKALKRHNNNKVLISLVVLISQIIISWRHISVYFIWV